MDLNKPRSSLSEKEMEKVDADLAKAKPYGSPRRVWVEDGHIFVEEQHGDIVSLTPEAAIALGRLLSEAGTDALINRVIDVTNGAAE